MSSEILAPAGSFAALRAAISAGADAVYLGATRFSARAMAQNFDDDALREAAEYCHLRGVKLYLAVNTLLRTAAEIADCAELLSLGADIGADAFIVQDLGVAKLARAIAPQVPLHGSTQMAVLSAEGFRLAASLGLRRAVLPREYSKQEIAAAVAGIPLETEVFVHGALCMSVSGHCYFSAALGDRSANRGSCAGPCRLPFRGGYPLSLRDLSIVDRLPELEAMGVTAFKIEGRMKPPEYVYGAVSACRAALDGRSFSRDELAALFSRSGFTDGYYAGRLGPTMFGVRTEADKHKTDSLEAPSAYPERKIPVAARCAVSAGGAALTLTCGAHTATAAAPAPAPAKEHPLTESELRAVLTKTGGTPFTFDPLSIELQSGLFYPKSALNALRRDAVAQLTALCTAVPPHTNGSCALPSGRGGAPRAQKRYALYDDAGAFSPGHLEHLDLTALPLGALAALPDAMIASGKIAALLPRAVFGSTGSLGPALREFRARGGTRALCPSLDGIAAAREAGLRPIADFSLNCLNALAAGELARLGADEITLSPEGRDRCVEDIPADIPAGVCLYGRLPLMVTRNCPVKNDPGFGDCGSAPCSLTDRRGVTFPVRCADGYAVLYNSRPLWLLDQPSRFRAADFTLLRFSVESADEAGRVIDDARRGAAPEGEFTRGLLRD